jgi:long-chain fatty acid transport protein
VAATRRGPASLLSIALLLLLGSPRAEASVPALFGLGARATAMGGAVTATASGPEAVYYNPGGLGFAEGPAFSIGFQDTNYFLDIDGAQASIAAVPATLIGFEIPLPFHGFLKDRLVLGFSFVLPDRSVLIADIPQPGVPRYVRFESGGESVSLMGGVGIRVLDELSVGVAGIALAALAGSISVAPNSAGKIGATVEDRLVVRVAPIAGVLFRPAALGSIGLTFHGESHADFTVPIKADLGPRFPLPIPLLDISGTAQYDPPQLALAGSLEPVDGLLLVAAAAYEGWSRFTNPLVYAAVPADYPPQPKPGFKDVIAVSAGAELSFDVGPWNLRPRLGGSFEPSPVPEQTGFHNYLDNNRFAVAAGFGIARFGLHLDASAQLQFLPERTDTKDPSQLTEPYAQNAGYPAITHGGTFLVWGLGLGAEL